ncbi:hypothetical protein BBP40_001408 [Aspergillus hancockii]|nr:hypothetical protein BBP40_001408 [Aspergillus hancockii]
MAQSRPHRIFNTPEILQGIFVQTETRHLLTSTQRVCPDWHRLIKNSPRLQAALFLNPSNESSRRRKTNPLVRGILIKPARRTAKPHCSGQTRVGGGSWSIIKIRDAHRDSRDELVQVTPDEELHLETLPEAMDSYNARLLLGIRLFTWVLFGNPGYPAILLNDGSVLNTYKRCDLLVYDSGFVPIGPCLDGDPASALDL